MEQHNLNLLPLRRAWKLLVIFDSLVEEIEKALDEINEEFERFHQEQEARFYGI